MYCPFIPKHLCSLASSSIFFHLPLKRGCFTGLSLCSLSLDNVICLPGVNCHIKVHGVMSIWVKYFPFTHLCCLPTSFLNSGHIFPNAVWKDPLHVTSYTDIHLFIFLLSPFFMIRSYLSLRVSSIMPRPQQKFSEYSVNGCPQVCQLHTSSTSS